MQHTLLKQFLATLLLILPASAFAIDLFEQQVIHEQVKIPRAFVFGNGDLDPGALTLASGDFDQDGDIDLLTSIGCWLQEDDELGEHRLWDSSYPLREISVSDLDNDGDLDFAGQSGNAVFAFMNDGQANFVIESISEQNMTLEHAGHLSPGTKEGVITTTLDGQFYYSYYDSAEQVWNSSLMYDPAVSGPITLLAYHDFDGEERLEVLAKHEGHLKIMKVVLGSLVEQQSLIPYDGTPFNIFFGDLDGNGQIDIVARTGASTNILWQEEPMLFTVEELYTGWSTPLPLAVADLNGDGIDDIFAWSDEATGLSLLFDDAGEYTIAEEQVQFVDGNQHSIITDDWDADGENDVIVMDFTARHAMMIAGGSNSLGEALSLYRGECLGVQNLLHADLNNDGWEDLVVTCFRGGQIFTSINQNGVFAPLQSYALTNVNAIEDALVEDLDNDGSKEIYFLGEQDSQLSLWILLLDAEGNLVDQRLLHQGEMNTKLHSHDIDEDGCKELSVQLMDGSVIGWDSACGIPGLFSRYELLPASIGNVDLFDYQMANVDGQNGLDMLTVTNGVSSKYVQVVPYQEGFDPNDAYNVTVGLNNSLDYGFQMDYLPQCNMNIVMIAGDQALEIFELGTETASLLQTLPPVALEVKSTYPLVDLDADGQLDWVLTNQLLRTNADCSGIELEDLQIPQRLTGKQVAIDADQDGLMELIVVDRWDRITMYTQVEPTPNIALAEQPQLLLYPNPVSSGQTLQLQSNEPIEVVRLYGPSGRLLYEEQLGSESLQTGITIPGLAAGMYYCAARSGGDSIMQKVLVVE